MKKLLATLLASTMALSAVSGLVACGEDEKTLTVWAPEAAINVYKQRVADWKKDNEQYKDWKVDFVVKAEGEAETDLGVDPTKGADIFFFEAGQIATMESKAYLQTLTADYSTLIKERDSAASYEPVERGDRMIAFPATSDNGYFMYYDKTFFSPTEVESLDSMLAKMEGTDKKIMFPYDDGYYQVTWFIGTGCTMDWVDEDQTKYFTDIHNTPAGLTAGKASIKYLGGHKNKWVTGGTGRMIQGFGDGTVVAAFSGTWGAQGTAQDGSLKTAIENGTRENKNYDEVVGAVKCPTFTFEDKTYQMGSFVGGKYCGVNRYKNNAETITASMSLANYFTDERGQMLRFQATEAGPSNKVVAEKDEVKNNMLLSALAAQNAAGGYAQLSQNGLWDAMKAFGTGCWDGTITEAGLQTALNDLATAMAKGGQLVTSKE